MLGTLPHSARGARSRQPDLILHIGMPKTGTTSVQAALSRAREGRDWRYLDLNEGKSANPVLRCAAGVTGSAQDAAQAVATIRGALRVGAKPRALISAEGMLRLPPRRIRHLVRAIEDQVRTLSAIAYIRAPISFITAFYLQSLHRRAVPMADLPRLLAAPLPDQVAGWERAVGPDAVILRPYARDRMDGGDTVSDFATELALGALPNLTRPRNTGLSDQAIRLWVLYRRGQNTPREADNRIQEVLRGLKGPRPRLHPEVLHPLTAWIEAARDLARMRLDWEMDEVWPEAGPTALRSDADFAQVDAETLEWLGACSGRPVASLRGRPEAIGAAVAALDQS